MTDFTATAATATTLATVEPVYDGDSIIPTYVVRNPLKDGDFLYAGESHRQACNVASEWNIAQACL